MFFSLWRLRNFLKNHSIKDPLEFYVCGFVEKIGEKEVLSSQGLRLFLQGQGPSLGSSNGNRMTLRIQCLENSQAQVCGPEIHLNHVAWAVEKSDRAGDEFKHWGRLELWQNFKQAIRSYFLQTGCLEVETPYLVASPGMEAHLEAFSTEFVCGGERKQFFLPTSPEFHLKKILARGGTDIFELKTCFRNGELSDIHAPEFLMLEWYRAFFSLEELMEDVLGLLRFLEKGGFIEGGLERPQKMSMQELFLEFAGFNLRPETTLKDWENFFNRKNLYVSPEASWNDFFTQAFLECVEPHLPREPLFIYNFPPQQAALAEVNLEGWAERFEFYWRGMELANAFYELRNPEEQKKRQQEANRERQDQGKEPYPLDEELLQSLSNLPPTSGIALGVERLFLACQNLKTIDELRFFPFKRD